MEYKKSGSVKNGPTLLSSYVLNLLFIAFKDIRELVFVHFFSK